MSSTGGSRGVMPPPEVLQEGRILSGCFVGRRLAQSIFPEHLIHVIYVPDLYSLLVPEPAQFEPRRRVQATTQLRLEGSLPPKILLVYKFHTGSDIQIRACNAIQFESESRANLEALFRLKRGWPIQVNSLSKSAMPRRPELRSPP